MPLPQYVPLSLPLPLPQRIACNTQCSYNEGVSTGIPHFALIECVCGLLRTTCPQVEIRENPGACSVMSQVAGADAVSQHAMQLLTQAHNEPHVTILPVTALMCKVSTHRFAGPRSWAEPAYLYIMLRSLTAASC
jgi:hypothetical protein